MYWRVILCMFFVMSDVQAAAGGVDFIGVSYQRFISCYFQGNHEFTQQLNTVIKQQARLGNGVIFDEPVVIGFSSRKPSNSGFYVNYEQYDCVPNFETMQSLCSIEVSGFKYGSVPSSYKKVYLDTLRSELVKRGQDSALLDGFVTALVRGFNDDQYGVEIDGLGVFSYDAKKSAVVFQSIPLNQFDAVVAAPGVLTALECNRGDVVDLSVHVIGNGTVAVTSNNQPFSNQTVDQNGVQHYYYPNYSQITLSATPAAGYHFHDFSCSGTDTGSSSSTVSPVTFGSASRMMLCDALFMEDAPVVPTIGNSQTNVRLTSVTGKFQRYGAPKLVQAFFYVGLNKYVVPHKLFSSLAITYCWQVESYNPRECYYDEDSGDVDGTTFRDMLQDVALGKEYTLTIQGVTVKFVVDGWANDNGRNFDLVYLYE